MHVNRREYRTNGANNKEVLYSVALDYRVYLADEVCLEKIKEITRYNQEAEEEEKEEKETTYLDRDIDDRNYNSEGDRLDEEQAVFILTLLNYRLASSEYKSRLISSIAVLGVSADRAWLDPLIYTPKQSAIISILRILVLY
ncbi:hypothetical protein GGP41_005487 [Bipolaris sorokiniana]|uniref:Uncharacterized protein n=1 Tax=Cochliobolus sativus TaxID=45130 RepID=A0A8H5ZGX0_COCSA|nr:hypothetical protein GGP41_005487 [Bipolaris sorokiniana]